MPSTVLLVTTPEPPLSAADAAAVKKVLADAAHRLRTPLTAILGFSDLLDMTDEPDTIREYVRIIKSNAELLNDMLTELLEGRAPRPRA